MSDKIKNIGLRVGSTNSHTKMILAADIFATILSLSTALSLAGILLSPRKNINPSQNLRRA